MKVESRIIDLLCGEGIEIEYIGQDIDLREYIVDSIQFIGFIVDVEDTFGIEISDEYLQYDSIMSLHAFAQLVSDCIEKYKS